MNCVRALAILMLFLAHSNASAAEACPNTAAFLSSLFGDPLGDYIQFTTDKGNKRFGKILERQPNGKWMIEDQFGHAFEIKPEQILQTSSKESKAYFHSPIHRIDRENEMITRTIPVEIRSVDRIEGKIQTQWVSGEIIRPDPSGNALERHAFGLEKNGKALIISEEAADLAGGQGYKENEVLLRAPGTQSFNKQDVIVITPQSLSEGKLGEAFPHEGSHAYLDHLNSTGNGTSFSINFKDYTPLRPGSRDFYETYRSLEEHMIWVQGLVRESRKYPEAQIKPFFMKHGQLRASDVFQVATLESQLIDAQKLLRTSKPKIAEGLNALKDAERMKASELRSLVTEGKNGHKKFYRVDVSNQKKMNIPINTRQEFQLIEKLNSPSVEMQNQAKNELFKIWNQKVKEQSDLTEVLISKVEWIRHDLKQLRGKGKITYQDYLKFKKTLDNAAQEVRIKKFKPQPLKSSSAP